MSPDTKICPSCSTDLTLFSAEDTSADVNPEELKSSLLNDNNGHLSELLKVAEEEKPYPDAPAGDMSMECPECGKPISADAESCPSCGVQFEMEEVFECPMCGTVMDLSVTKCPGCGVQFEDEAPPAEEKKPEPVPEKKPEPASFVERLKQVKDEPGPPPEPPKQQRELSFAERMKAMKEGKSPEEISTQPEPAKQPAGTGTNISERVKSLQQSAPAPSQQPTPAPASQKPEQAKPASQGVKDLPKYIGEVKRLLILANELKIDVSTSKATINKAVTAGKNKELETAIKFVREGKTGIERELRSAYLSKLRTMESAIELEKKSGINVSELASMLSETRKSLEAGDFQVASDALKKIEEQILKSSPTKLSRAEMDTLACAIENAAFLRLNVSEAKSIYEEAKAAASKNETQKSAQLTKKASESLNRVLPAYIASEMRKAKVTLREIKLMNVDISSLVQMLKEANDNVLHGDYCAALGHIKSFKEFTQKLEK